MRTALVAPDAIRHMIPAIAVAVILATSTAAGAPAGEDRRDDAIRVSHGKAPRPPAAQYAYDQLRAGRLDDAAAEYRRVLHKDPTNVDALIGLAFVAARRQQTSVAERWYARALGVDPGNVDAEAGLLDLHGAAGPTATESRLQNLLAAHPESAALYAALGNHYARQARWPEAAQAYARSLRGRTDDGDLLYSLAVSLDHLDRPDAARTNYAAALAAATAGRASFDESLVTARMRQLARRETVR